jgi:hypothetical protein
MTGKVLPTARVGESAPTQEARREERDETGRLDGKGLGASQHPEGAQGGEPEKRQLQQHPQPKPKPRLQLKQQSEQLHEPKPKPIPTPGQKLGDSPTAYPESEGAHRPRLRPDAK